MSKIKLLLNNSKYLFNQIQKVILDGLFPIKCLGCDSFDEWICKDCHSTLPILTEQHCPVCKKHITENGQICTKCLSTSIYPLDGIFIASHYSDNLLKKAIHYYKYRFVYTLSEPLALLLAQSLQNSTLSSPDILIPVPLHKRRLRWRGFNQAELLATNLDLQISINTDILLRVKYTSSQVKVKNKNKRQENLANAFIVIDNSKVINKNILLIDDIVTTGSTLKECAIVLKKAGAKKVSCIVLARN